MENEIETGSSSDDSQHAPHFSAVSEEQQIDPLEVNRYFQLMNQVFNEDLLREMIIDYVIHERKLTSSPGIKKCRLVNKSWLHTVSKLGQKNHRPVFLLSLDKDNSLQESGFVQQNGKLLDKFLCASLRNTSPSFVDDRIPSFAIKATQDFFKDENYHSFRDLLLKSGSGLVHIDLEIPNDGGSMPFLLPFSPQLSLPILTDFTIRFAAPTNHGDDDMGRNVTALCIIQSILNASHHSLKQFNLPFTQNYALPAGSEHLSLPASTSTVDLSCQMNNENLRILLNNSLPNLKQLSLLILDEPFDDGMISRIVEKSCETLEKVEFKGITHDGAPNLPTYFKIPAVMKNLKQIFIVSAHLELEDDLSSLESCLPALNELILTHQTIPMFRKWTDNSKFENVTQLRMSLVDKDFGRFHENYFINVDVEIMQCLQLAFPNLKILEITVYGSEMAGFEYLLLEMKQLENLHICVGRTENLLNSDFWDALLIGIKIEFAAALRTTPGFWESFEVKDSSRPSIRNLASLHTCKIISEAVPLALAKVPLISDSVFHFGFFKLPKLKKLILGGRFFSSDEIRKEWKAGNGKRHEIFNEAEYTDLN